MKRVLLYALLFPPLTLAFLLTVARAHPFELAHFGWLIFSAYLAGLFPAVLTALVHTALRNRGLHSIFAIFVAALLTPVLVNSWIGTLRDREFVVVGIGASFAALCCWGISRIGQKKRRVA